MVSSKCLSENNPLDNAQELPLRSGAKEAIQHSGLFIENDLPSLEDNPRTTVADVGPEESAYEDLSVQDVIT